MALPFFSRVMAALRKRPPESKTPPPAAAGADEVVPKEVPPSQTVAAPVHLSKEWLSKLAQVGNALWRLRRRLCDPQTGQPREEMRRHFRDLESAWEALQQAGVDIRDHTGDDYDSGYALVCLAFQPTPGLNRERVIETMRPTITIMGQLVQMGEIIVGIPETAQPEAKAAAPSDDAGPPE